jgi:hypothetical protein
MQEAENGGFLGDAMSRYSSYDDVDAKCPYYTGSTATDVRCDRVGGGCMIVRFATPADKKAFRAKRCDCMDYELCELYDAHLIQW